MYDHIICVKDMLLRVCVWVWANCFGRTMNNAGLDLAFMYPRAEPKIIRAESGRVCGYKSTKAIVNVRILILILKWYWYCNAWSTSECTIQAHLADSLTTTVNVGYWFWMMRWYSLCSLGEVCRYGRDDVCRSRRTRWQAAKLVSLTRKIWEWDF